MMRPAILALAALLAVPAAAQTPAPQTATPPALAAHGYVEEQASLGAARLTVRRPRDAANFYGSVVLEPVSGPDAPGWRAAGTALMAHGDVWVGVAAPAGQLADAARLLRDGAASPLARPGLLARAAGLQGMLKIYALGWGPGACGIGDFIAGGGAVAARRTDGRPAINGYVLGGCDRAQALAPPAGAALVRIATERDYPAAADVRRPDGNVSGTDWHRWYDVRVTAACPGADVMLRTSLASLDHWMRTGVPAPAGMAFALGDDRRPRPGAAAGVPDVCDPAVAAAGKPQDTPETARRPQLEQSRR